MPDKTYPLVSPVFEDPERERLYLHGREYLPVDGREYAALKRLAKDLFLAASIQKGNFPKMRIQYSGGDWRPFEERMAELGLLNADDKPLDEKTVARTNALKAMHLLASHFNDEELESAWTSFGVPDGATDEEIEEIAGPEETFEACADLFAKLVSGKQFAESGFCFD